MYRTIKAIKPDADVGWHVDHQPSSWDLVYRAEMSLTRRPPLRFHQVHRVSRRARAAHPVLVSRTVSEDDSRRAIPRGSLDLYYDLFGYDKKVEPKLNELATKGFSPDYVFRETKRSVASAEGKTKIYTGIGFDVPWGNRLLDADPEVVYQCVMKAFEAGANGLWSPGNTKRCRFPI